MREKITVNVPLIIDVLNELRNIDTQKKLWVVGDSNQVSSLEEAIAGLYDDSVLGDALEKGDIVFDADIDFKFNKLSKLFSKLDRNRSAADIIYTKEWNKIMKLSNELYNLVRTSRTAKNWSPDNLKGSD